MIKTATDPNAMLQQLANNNPQLMQTMNYVQSAFNGDGEKAFMSAAKAKGMTDEQIQQFLAALK